MSDRPLSRLRILEVGHMLAGPYCGMLLSDLGAEVIKIEMPPGGDIARSTGKHRIGDSTTYFASLNRGKKSVTLDLASADGRAAFHALVATADGVITNLRPGAIRKLGLDYATLGAVNPRIACLALTGFGLTGPYADRPAYDYIIQAMIGLMALTGDPGGTPTKTGYSVVDNSAGIMAALGLVAMIHGGKGGQADVSLYDVMISQMNYLAADYLNAAEVPQRQHSGSHPFFVPAQIFATADGHLAIFISHDRFWQVFCDAVGQPGWKVDPAFATMAARDANRVPVLAALSALLRGRTTQEWVDLLEPVGIVIAGVSTLDHALDSDLTRARGMVVDIALDDGTLRLVGSPILIEGSSPDYRRAPRLGEHTAHLAGQTAGRPHAV
jgi:CoA:oxalate CoA-transferase